MRDQRNDSYTTHNLTVTLGACLAAGFVVGAVAALLLAPTSGPKLRSDIAGKARDLKAASAARFRRAGHAAKVLSGAATDWVEQGRDLADRARSAAGEGLREARRHMTLATDPRRADMSGVAGMSAEGS